MISKLLYIQKIKKSLKKWKNESFWCLAYLMLKKWPVKFFSGVFYNVSKFKIRALPLASFISKEMILCFWQKDKLTKRPSTKRSSIKKFWVAKNYLGWKDKLIFKLDFPTFSLPHTFDRFFSTELLLKGKVLHEGHTCCLLR